MGWTGEELHGAFSARVAIEFDLGAQFAARVIDTARYRGMIYAAVRSHDAQERGARFRGPDGAHRPITNWRELEYEVSR
jgi:hypothetical protein